MNPLFLKLWKWYKGHKDDASAHHDKYTDADVIDALANADKVGIGTDTPITPIHIVGKTDIDALGMPLFFESERSRFGYGVTPTSNAKVAFGSGWGTPLDFAIHTKSSGDFSASTQRFTVKMDGKVGIGTDTPITPIHIVGKTDIDALGMPLFFESERSRFGYGVTPTSNAKVAFGSGWGTGVDFAVYTKSSGNFSENTQRFTVKMDGKVGIATTAPTSKLDVNSDILRLRTAKTPASASATGNQGDICWDSSYVYVCVAANTWKRSAISTW